MGGPAYHHQHALHWWEPESNTIHLGIEDEFIGLGWQFFIPDDEVTLYLEWLGAELEINDSIFTLRRQNKLKLETWAYACDRDAEELLYCECRGVGSVVDEWGHLVPCETCEAWGR